MTAQPALSTWQ